MLPSVDFNYGMLPPEKAEAARAAAERIKVRMSRAAGDIVEVGRDLAEQKKHLGHGNFLAWIESEFSMSQQSASNFMRVNERFGDKLPTIGNLGATALYLLASETTPEPIRQEVLAKAAAGEKVTAKEIESLRKKLAKAEEEAAENASLASMREARAKEAEAQRDGAQNELLFVKSDLIVANEEIERLKETGVVHVLSPSDPIQQFNDVFVAPANEPTPWTDDDAQFRTIQAVWKDASLNARVMFMKWAGLTSLNDA